MNLVKTLLSEKAETENRVNINRDIGLCHLEFKCIMK